MIKIKLELDEAKQIHAALMQYDSASVDLIGYIETLISHEEELENMDLDDCPSGACKL